MKKQVERKKHEFNYDKFVRQNRQGAGCLLTSTYFMFSLIGFLICLADSLALAIVALIMEIGMYMILRKVIKWIMKKNDEMM